MCYVFYQCGLIIYFFFFKQKTAYEMRISDWSSDVCSSDLGSGRQSLDLRLVGRRPARIIVGQPAAQIAVEHRIRRRVVEVVAGEIADTQPLDRRGEIGRASCRERVCQYV